MSKECKSNDWNINFRAKNKTNFKAGADLTEKVDVHVDLNEEADENSEAATIKMNVKGESEPLFGLKLETKRKTKFKAGADLTDKVNLVDVEWNREETETEESIFIGVRLKTTSCTETKAEDKAQ